MPDLITLLPGGVEYVTWTLAGLPDPAPGVEVSLDKGTTWHPATLDAGTAKLLIAHPTSPTAGAVTASAGQVTMLLRLTDTPEVVVRHAGTLYCPT